MCRRLEALDRASLAMGEALARSGAEACERLWAAVQVRESQLATLARDLVDPLSAVQLSAEALARLAPRGDGWRGQKLVDILVRAGRRMRRRFDEILLASEAPRAEGKQVSAP